MSTWHILDSPRKRLSMMDCVDQVGLPMGVSVGTSRGAGLDDLNRSGKTFPECGWHLLVATKIKGRRRRKASLFACLVFTSAGEFICLVAAAADSLTDVGTHLFGCPMWTDGWRQSRSPPGLWTAEVPSLMGSQPLPCEDVMGQLWRYHVSQSNESPCNMNVCYWFCSERTMTNTTPIVITIKRPPPGFF